jgi:hypothetical protein
VQFRDNFSRFPKNRFWFGPILLPFSRWQVCDLIFQPQKNEEGVGSSVFSHGWKSSRVFDKESLGLRALRLLRKASLIRYYSSDGSR